MAYLLQFGGFAFPSGFAPMSHESPKDLAEQERPRASGAVTQAARQQARRLSVEGSAMGFGGGPAAVQAAVDAVRGACEAGGPPQPLFFGRDDRFVLAQCSGVSESYQEGGGGSWYGASHRLLISFLAGDPFFYATGQTPAPGLTGAGGTVTPGGNAPAFAAWSITVTAGGAGQIVLANATTGQSALLGTAGTAWAAGDVVALTRTATSYTVTKNGQTAPGLMAGLIPTLALGANVITLAAPAGVTLAPLGCTYTARWQS